MGSLRKLLSAYGVRSKQSEAHKHNQNPAECRIQVIKGTNFTILNCYDAPSWSWLLCMACVVSIINFMDHLSLYWRNPHEDEYGFMTNFAHSMETILIFDEKTQFTDSRGIFGYYSGTAPNKGALDCSWVWNDDHVLLARSIIHHDNSPTHPNLQMVTVIGEIKEYSSNLETFNFVSANEVKYGTDGTLPTLIYKMV